MNAKERKKLTKRFITRLRATRACRYRASRIIIECDRNPERAAEQLSASPVLCALLRAKLPTNTPDQIDWQAVAEAIIERGLEEDYRLRPAFVIDPKEEQT